MFGFLFKKKVEPRKSLPGEVIFLSSRLDAFDLDRFNIQGIQNLPTLHVLLKEQKKEFSYE